MNILNKEQLAEYLSVKTGAIDWLIRTREVPLIRIGKRRFVFDRADIDAWLEKKKEKTQITGLIGKLRR
jgi:excisionase family DNA binding protein